MRQWRTLGLWMIFFALGGCSTPLSADEIRVGTWNVHEGFSPEKIRARAPKLSALAAKHRPDVLVIEEITSRAVAEAVRDAMGLRGYHVACSNFNPSDAPDFGAFEVAVISRFPITQVVEYDPSPDNRTDGTDPPELPILPLLKRGFAEPPGAGGGRGFLWVRIDALRLTVIGVHLKSSRGSGGAEDVANAQLREFVAAAVAESVAQDLRLFPDHTCLVAGDFNVGHADLKNGRDPYRDDLQTSSTSDGYDDTHALLRDGVLGLKMRNLCESIRESSYPGFNSTPIDNIYVAGVEAARFSPAVMDLETYGSDHRPMMSRWLTTPKSGPAATAAVGSAPTASTITTLPTTKSTAPRSGGLPASSLVVGPKDVGKYLNGRCTVEFDVRAANLQPSTPPIGFLNSEVDFRSEDNFTVVVFDEGLQKYAQAGVTDFAAHFRGKRVRVTGQVTNRRDRLQIVVSDPSQIELVK